MNLITIEGKLFVQTKLKQGKTGTYCIIKNAPDNLQAGATFKVYFSNKQIAKLRKIGIKSEGEYNVCIYGFLAQSTFSNVYICATYVSLFDFNLNEIRDETSIALKKYKGEKYGEEIEED